MLQGRGAQLGYNPILGDGKHANDWIAEMQLCHCYYICKEKGKHEIINIKLRLLSIQPAWNFREGGAVGSYNCSNCLIH